MRRSVSCAVGLILFAIVLVVVAYEAVIFIVAALLFALMLTLFPRLRSKELFSNARRVILAAFWWCLALVLVSGLFVIAIPITSTWAVGIERYHLLSIVDTGVREKFAPISVPFTLTPQFRLQSPDWPFNFKTSSGQLLYPSGHWIETSMVPIVPAFFILVLPSILFWVLRPKVIEPGRCFQCLYDLTGNTSGVCPECGTKIQA